jgi:hypothetical protein
MNVTSWRVLVIIFTVEKKKVILIVRVSVAFVTQHALRMHRIVTCGLSGTAGVFQIIS